MKKEFTKGEWKVITHNEDIGNIYVETSDEVIAKLFFCNTLPRDEAKVNAKLIAAAPDLLEALMAVVAVADRKTDEFDKAKEAIKKATT